MHLCANVLLGRLLPEGTIVRRNFCFQAGEKSWPNRLYRAGVDSLLSSRHRHTDLFYSLPPLQPPTRVKQVFSLAHEFSVEVETHPANDEEHRFLMSPEIYACLGDVSISSHYDLAARQCAPMARDGQ